ncbi:uncharacterized protein EAF02_006682 [Botrytis sinoallii]|uniref:uncharacterized protein n=1 Tax=Botrytis sinoallii TaxID=1463999 RepID=UPI0019027DE8|nr:uncharacterized protein EAF02_006682 [Botrytis sinoallii]KAF7880791.1 hypothetical protein EAF02_006682 [Botrytis sinoallii]
MPHRSLYRSILFLFSNLTTSLDKNDTISKICNHVRRLNLGASLAIAPGIVEDRPKQTRRNGISTGKKVKLDLVTAAEWASSSPVVGTSNGGCDVITLFTIR